MGVDLFGNGAFEYFNWTNWTFLLRLAYRFGWEPQGTILDDFERDLLTMGKTLSQEDIRYWEERKAEWDGGYSSNDLQQVAAGDARNIADALERALESGSDPETGESLTDYRALIEDFVQFCRRGAFRIS